MAGFTGFSFPFGYAPILARAGEEAALVGPGGCEGEERDEKEEDVGVDIRGLHDAWMGLGFSGAGRWMVRGAF